MGASWTGLFLASLPDGDQEGAGGPGGSLGLSLVLRSSGRGYPERREFPRDPAGGGGGVCIVVALSRKRQTPGLAPDIQREWSGISLTPAQSQTLPLATPLSLGSKGRQGRLPTHAASASRGTVSPARPPPRSPLPPAPEAGPVPVPAQELPRLSLGKFKSPNVLFPGWGGDLF